MILFIHRKIRLVIQSVAKDLLYRQKKKSGAHIVDAGLFLFN
jgi:hypothetical protein